MDRILATHTGSLIRPPELLAFLAARDAGQSYDEARYADALRRAVNDIVAQQVDAGIDVVDDGEMGKTSWITYLYERVSGLEARLVTLEGASMLPPSRDRQQFPGAYTEPRRSTRPPPARATSPRRDPGATMGRVGTVSARSCSGSVPARSPMTAPLLTVTSPTCAPPWRTIPTPRPSPVVAPASAYWLANEHYGSEEEVVYALADALHEEYEAIVDAGFLLQVDDAVLMHEWDTMLSRGQTDDDYRRWAQLRVDALNHALRGLPEDRIRYHVCWGSWHGPHAYDPPLKDTVGLILQVTAGYYAMEQANSRHEHEWRVWEDVALPEGKKLIPGVVTHHTNVVEHPELVAQRLIRLANLVGRENVLAGTDCGFAQGAFIHRVHPEIQWAKLAALAEGARLASRELWGAAAAV